ncbi:uncharacterized protein [Gossypium hirsutum]|uniref:Uncharacterized protein n=1 Tax=Gossypium hirsutum TaxID=3635 RepID=A0A1U8IDK8_GOSHI|nr:uncharacterized protein LOC107895531 [Gossypium hirsutum]
MDFVSEFPLTPTKKHSIWVIVDQLTKFAHFIPVKTDYSLQKLVKLYVSETIFVPSDVDFTQSILWEVHSSPYAMHIGDIKMFYKLQKLYWWHRLKREVLDPELVARTKDNVRFIQDRLKASSDRQNSYAELKRKDIEFEVWDCVFLKVSPWKKAIRFCCKSKFSPRFIRPYQILRHVGLVAYQLELPLKLDYIDEVFHVSKLRSFLCGSSVEN